MKKVVLCAVLAVMAAAFAQDAQRLEQLFATGQSFEDSEEYDRTIAVYLTPNFEDAKNNMEEIRDKMEEIRGEVRGEREEVVRGQAT